MRGKDRIGKSYCCLIEFLQLALSTDFLTVAVHFPMEARSCSPRSDPAYGTEGEQECDKGFIAQVIC